MKVYNDFIDRMNAIYDTILTLLLFTMKNNSL